MNYFSLVNVFFNSVKTKIESLNFHLLIYFSKLKQLSKFYALQYLLYFTLHVHNMINSRLIVHAQLDICVCTD